MAEIKDSGRGDFYWSRPRIMGLIFGAVVSPIFFVLAAFGHENAGGILWAATCMGLTIAYVLPTKFRKFMQRLIPTTAEQAERASLTGD